MAYRDAEMPPKEFLQFILEVKRTQMMGIGRGPAITVVDGCTGYVLTGKQYLPGMVPDLATRLAEWTG